MDIASRYIVKSSDRQLAEMTVSRWARALNMSRSYLYKIFRIQRDFKPGDYLRGTKLYRASILIIKNKNLSITSVAHHFGFNSAYHFNVAFKTLYGISPSNFRKKNPKNKSKNK
ncbi:MAG: helix-turn-helix transcriptional regulator [bacterium]|nr:helix-turn-helix transcriptional regulator [bacterium]